LLLAICELLLSSSSLNKDLDPFVLQVEQHSRLLLVVWATYCLMCSAASAQHRLVAEYGMALQFEDLR
jgi:hypothetical protein